MNVFIYRALRLIRSINTNVDGSASERVHMVGGTVYILISMEEKAESIWIPDTCL